VRDKPISNHSYISLTLHSFRQESTLHTFRHEPTLHTFRHDSTLHTIRHDATLHIFRPDPTLHTFRHDSTVGPTFTCRQVTGMIQSINQEIIVKIKVLLPPTYVILADFGCPVWDRLSCHKHIPCKYGL
jgi:hypothetical protein